MTRKLKCVRENMKLFNASNYVPDVHVKLNYPYKISKRSLHSLGSLAGLDETADTLQQSLLRKRHFSYQGFRSPAGPVVQFKTF